MRRQDGLKGTGANRFQDVKAEVEKEKEKEKEKEEHRQASLAYSVGGRVGSRGLVLATAMRNRFNSSDVGVVLNLGDNPDEIIYVGQVR